jgi:hypothetical protein
MGRTLWLTFVFLMTLPVIAFSENRFYSVIRHVITERVTSSGQKVSEDRVEAGDMHSIVSQDSLEVSWTAANGKVRDWLIGPDLFQDRVNCPEFIQCAGSAFPCYGKCIFSPPVVEQYDSRDKKIYFSVRLDFGGRGPFAVFRADLEDQKVDFLFQEAGSNLMGFAFSPSESRLAFLVGLSITACAGMSHLNVFDLQKGVLLNPAVKPRSKYSLRENVSYDSVEWLSETKLHLRGYTWNCQPRRLKNVLIPIDAVVTLPNN